MPTYFVRSSGGSDDPETNDGLSFEFGWATIQYAADTAVAGDLVLICADGAHTTTSTIDFDTNAGGLSNSIIFRGANATGGDDGTVATISGSALGANDILINITMSYLVFENLRITNATDHNLRQDVTGFTTFIRCRIDSATDHGIYQLGSIGMVSLFDCEIDNNAIGIGSASGFRGHVNMSRCSVHDNTGHGLDLYSYSNLHSILDTV